MQSSSLSLSSLFLFDPKKEGRERERVEKERAEDDWAPIKSSHLSPLHPSQPSRDRKRSGKDTHTDSNSKTYISHIVPALDTLDTVSEVVA